MNKQKHKQIIPCNEDMYAVFKDDETGYDFKRRVLYLMIDELNHFKMLVFDCRKGVIEVNELADWTDHRFCYFELEKEEYDV